MNGFDQQIRRCISPDNVKIVYARTGSGLPLVKTGNWLTDLETDAESFLWRHWIEEFSQNRLFFRFDHSGSRDAAADFSLEAQLRDIETVAADAGLERFALLGISNGAAAAVAYAALRPENVDCLILLNGAAGGRSEIFSGKSGRKYEDFLRAVNDCWGSENESLQRTVADLILPGLPAGRLTELAGLEKRSCLPAAACAALESFFATDISEPARKVKCPTIIFHSIGDELIPFSQAGLLSGLIPDSKLILLQSRNHFLLADEPAWREFSAEVKAFFEELKEKEPESEFRVDLQATIPMEDARWEQVGELFAEAMKLPADSRRQLLSRLDSEAFDLRREVEALIENAERRPQTEAAGPIPETSAESRAENEIFENQLVSHYKILGRLGGGGMGEVFRAMDLALEREVALKFLPRRYNNNAAMKQRFRREAQAAAALDHPNICAVFEVGETGDGRLFIAMPFYKGKTLKEKILENSVTVKDAVEYARQAAEGLAHAHEAGIIHRDIKPENILITEAGVLKILDFGVAKITDAEITQKGVLLGTISYMSPEQAAGEKVDERSDLWSLGLVLYEALTGRQPFRDDEISTMISTILLREPAPVSDIAEGIPPELEKIVQRALRKNKAERYQTARQMAEDLKNLEALIAGGERAPKPHFNYEKFAPLAVEKTPNNLAAQLTPLIGRGREINEIVNLLSESDVRLVTLTGIGGTGKTRLAHKIARRMLADFPDGVFFVELSTIAKAELVAPEIAQVLGIRESGSEQIENILKSHLSDKKMLLVLDNFEQITEAAPQIGELLGAAPKLKILVTSRHPLRLRGEHEYKVPPLDLPDPGRLHSEASLAGYASVSLFIQRARALRSDFELTEENASQIARICERLEGLPLAIELAAARIKILSPKEMLARLDDQLKFLTGGARDLPARQQTMRNAIGWSYELLEEEERRVFRQLSVFVGGCTLEAIEAVCSCGGEIDVLESVFSLTDKSLLRGTQRSEGETRFRMLEVVRQFSAEKLSESDELARTRQKHADFYLDFAERLEPFLRGAEQAKWLDRLEEEHGNMRAALEYFLENDIEKALRLSGALHRLWSVHGHYTEGRNWLQTVLEKGRDASKAARAKALIPAADLAWSQGDLDAAARFYEECLRLSREIGDEKKIAQSCNGLGITRLNKNDFDIRPLLEESLTIGRRLGDKAIVGVALMGLGEVARLEGNYREAHAFYQETLTEARKGGDSFNLLYALFNLGSVSCMEGDAATAREQFAESISIAADLGSRRAVADCLDGFAALSAMNGDFEKAARLFGAAEALRESVGFEIQTADRIFRDHFIEKTKNSIGEKTFSELKAQGKTIPFEDAVDLALK
jgi:predicted ATPase/pimeloyl-ACP methyl ester carboxylesterase